MLRAKQLGNVVFEHNTLFIKEQFESDGVVGAEYTTAAGTRVYYGANIYTPHVTLDGQSYGWVEDDQRAELIAMWGNVGQSYTLTYNDNSTATVYMRPDSKPVFTPLYEGACKYSPLLFLTT